MRARPASLAARGEGQQREAGLLGLAAARLHRCRHRRRRLPREEQRRAVALRPRQAGRRRA